jgi:ABC-2 type transport system permease protein
MRWLLAKDLRILARSRLLVAVLVIYPVAISLLIGLALSRGPSKPRVAVADLAVPGSAVEIGGRRLTVAKYAKELFASIEVVKAHTRSAAVSDVSSGRALAAIVIPADIVSKISSGVSQAEVEVLYNGDALQQSFVRASIDSALAQANLALSKQIKGVAVHDLELLLEGGKLGLFGSTQRLVGLSNLGPQLQRLAAQQSSPAARAQLQRLAHFASFASTSLGLSKNVLGTVSEPILVKRKLLHARRTPLDAFAVVVAVSTSLMFFAVLLAAGALALEREEHALARLLRGGGRRQPPSRDGWRGRFSRGRRQPPSRGRGSRLSGRDGHSSALVSAYELIAEKATLAAVCAFALAVAMLAGIGAFVALHWDRLPLWLAALALSALAFASLGVALGALAREVRAASLLAFLLCLPLAFLALVPTGSVAGGLYDLIAAISFVFPFKPALEALDAAVNGSSPGLAICLVHLLVLTLVFGALARLGLRRLG